MLKLIALSVTCCVVAFGATAQATTAQSLAPDFDPRAHLCTNTEQPLTTCREIVVLNAFLTDVRHGTETPSPADCRSNRIETITLMTRMADNIEMASSAAAFVSFWVGRSYKAETFEAKYANDAEMLIYAGLLCDVLSQDRASCFRALASSTPERFRAESPVFCDFAPTGMRNPGTDGSTLDDSALRELPGICGALLDEGDTDSTAAV